MFYFFFVSFDFKAVLKNGIKCYGGFAALASSHTKVVCPQQQGQSGECSGAETSRSCISGTAPKTGSLE